ncbi:MAG: DUF1003 domain-containing protein [Patescibacteria group bacterium]|nr:DUF1003 domain-containing protein [Patescibacteria group bacterium]
MVDDTHTPHPWIEGRKKFDPRLKRQRFNDRLAILITNIFGTVGMFYALVLWMFAWMFLATAGVWYFRLDPYPFPFLLFLSNLIQLWALPILAVGQQVLSRAADKQAAQTFRDAEEILKLQDEVHRLIKINNRLTEEIHAVVRSQTNQK